MPSQIYHVQSRLFPCVTDCQGKVGFHSSFFGEDPGCPLPLASQFVENSCGLSAFFSVGSLAARVPVAYSRGGTYHEVVNGLEGNVGTFQCVFLIMLT